MSQTSQSCAEPLTATLVELLRRRARERPDEVVYTFLLDGEAEEALLTYGELDARARAVAALLAEHGAAGERALLLYPPGLDYVTAFFGCLYAGVVAVPVYPPPPHRPATRLLAILADARPRLALADRATLARGGRQLAAAGLQLLATDDLPPECAAAWREPAVDGESLAFLQYTSGSTAAPKGVMLTHGNLLANLDLISRSFALSSADRSVIWLPPYHDMGLIGGLLSPVYAGYPATLLSPVAFLQQPLRWLRAISRSGATVSGGPNFAYDLCCRKVPLEERQGLDLSRWSVAFNGAEPVRAETLDRFAAAFAPCGFRREAFFPCYGLAEATLLVTGVERREPPLVGSFVAAELERHRAVAAPDAAEAEKERRLVGCGRSSAGQEVVIVRPEACTPCASGEVGEIWVRGPSVARGYWERPEETAGSFGARLAAPDGPSDPLAGGPFLRTGDLGFLAEGQLFVTGRAKDLIILRGRNHYPQDLEATVERSHPALRPGCGAAFAVEVEGEERLVVAQEVVRGARDTAGEEAVAAIRRALAEEHEVRVYAVALLRPATLPKTSSGKVRRHAVRAAFLAGTLETLGEWRLPRREMEADTDGDEALATAAEIEAWLAAEVATRAGVAPREVDRALPLAHAGLDSLDVLELQHAIEARCGVEVPVESFFEGIGLAELARGLAEGRGAGAAPAEEAGTEAPAADAGEQPLSRNQLALWFLHLLEPQSPAYNVPAAVRVRGPLDAEALRRAFQALVDRHASLRTTFTAASGEPRQAVRDHAEVAFAVENAAEWSAERLAERVAEEAHRPFDLAAGPLLRVFLLRCGAEGHLLLVVLHHIVTDLWSLGVLLDELATLYPAFAAGQPAELPSAASYAEFARWQERMLAGERGERLWAYWRERLAGELPVLELPTDRPWPPVQTYEGAALRVRLEREVVERLTALGRRRGATPFATLAAAFAALLHRLTGQDDLLLGTVASGRGRAAFARTVGYFVNPLVLRADLSGALAFTALLDRARRDVLGAFEHQDLPFPLLVERLQPARDPSRSPLFQVMLAWQRGELADGQDLTAFALGGEGARVALGELELAFHPLPQRIAQFDLTLTLGELEGSVAGTLDYNTRLFDAATADRLVARFARLLGEIAAEPERPVADLPLLPAAEERQLLAIADGGRAALAAAGAPTLADLVLTQARQTPAAPAVLAAGGRLTYGELAAGTERLARRLQRLGAGPETLVGVYLERSLQLPLATLGVLAAGAGYLPLDPAEPWERTRWKLADAGVRLVVTRGRHPMLTASGFTAVPLAEALAEEGAGPVDHAAGADNLACLIYTSGSTGRPKGVLLAHRALTSLVASFLASYRPGPADRMLPATAIAYASFAGELFPLLSAGGAVVLPGEAELLDPAALVELIRRAEVSIASTVPSVLAGLNALPELPPRLRLLLVGGEALAAGDIDRLLGAGGRSVEVVNGYGLTETGICSTVHVLAAADVDAGRKPPIGHPVANHQVYVLDPTLQPAPLGVPGELYVGGEGLARGYLNDPALTAERFVPSPYAAGARLYRTGDRAAWGSDGVLHYLGRLDQQVKVRGFRIEPEEIESALALHPRVREATVVLRQDRGAPPRLVAYVVAAEPAPAADELLSFLRESLPEPMVPAVAVFLAALPLGPSGKVDPRRLPPPPAERPELSAVFTAPRSELERRIAAVWQEALGLPSVGIHDNFFDLGGHSLLLAKVHAALKRDLGRELSLVDLFRYPTVAALAQALAAGEGGAPAAAPARAAAPRPRKDAGSELAIVGMAGRFPGAKSVAQLWRNLVAERESITFFDDEELRAAGVDPALLADPSYVKAKGILGDVELFDAGFFGLNPREAELMDPQHRLFLECCWEALEAAGYDPERTPGRVGVYGGLSMNTYLLMNLLPHLELVASADTLQASLGNDKDPLTARVAYKLNLRGPSVTVQTASSTSLAAVHLAAKGVLQGDCEMALAGGVSIHLPERTGYLYQEGGTVSRDGHCRAFDAAATGFVSGHGAGVVVLKRLEDAVAGGDHIHAVLKGSACNNDGSLKVSFMAPSVEGQVDVYCRAYEDAGVGAETVGYVECHGTGTALGDPIEIAALSQVFAAATPRRQFCAIGSLKTNIGHLDTAAGVCGLIKAALALEHRILPASLHYETPNPQIDFAASPFFVNAATRPWESDGAPRRAGVTSLGMGGTNVHVVLEEPPPAPAAAAAARPLQLLPLSAKSATALDALTLRLADDLHDRPELPLPDVAWTLQVGRRPFAHRRLLLARDTADAAGTLAVLDPERVLAGVAMPGERPVAFLLTGQGAQYSGMGRGLYEREPAFRAEFDRCAELLEPHLGSDVRELLFPAGESPEAALRLEQTAMAQPVLFAVAWATARLWMSWGVRPAALLGHSLGELVGACLAGVLQLGDALALVALRGRLMQQMPPGAMLAVQLPEAELAPLLADDLALAVVNGPAACVVSGSAAAVEALAIRLEARGVPSRRLHTSHAFHSPMMEPAVRPFVERVAACRLAAPAIPFLSNVTGTWIRAEEATDPEYWGRQIRATVRFADGLAALLAEPRRVLLEAGPGNTLATLARQHPARGAEQVVLWSLPHAKETADDQAHLLTTLGRLWLAGVEVDWEAFAAPEGRRRRVPLPTYPFERQRYWVEPGRAGARRPADGRRREPSDWFYAPGWKQAPLPAAARETPDAPSSWLLLRDGARLGGLLAERLEAAGHRVVTAVAGADFRRLGPGVWQVRPVHAEDYEALLAAVQPRRILHLWALDAAGSDPELLERCFEAPLALARALARRGGEEKVVLGIVADSLAQVTGGERLEPLKATLFGTCLVAPREEPRLACRLLDVDLADTDPEALADRVLREMSAATGEPVVAYRRHLRWVRSFEPVRLPAADEPPPRLRREGVYLITGGLGGLGLAVAGHLARTVRAKLVLVGRSPLPPREEWSEWLTAHGEGEKTGRRLRSLLKLEEAGAELLILAADVADRQAMRAVRRAAEERFGRVHGVVHAAGLPGGALIQAEDRQAASRVMAPKVEGTRVLEEVFAGAGLELLVLFSSITAVLPQLGQSAYVAANAFLDATAARAAGGDGPYTVAIGWDAWREVGMAVETEVPRELEAWRRASLAQGLATAEGLDAFDRVLASGLTQVVVSTLDLAWRREENAREVAAAAALEVEAPAVTYPRTLATPYVPPGSDFERAVAEIWQEMLGVEQVGVHDNFFDLGGNSLAGLRVTRRLKDRLGADVSEVSLYEAPTVAALARLLAPQETEEGAPEAAQGRSRGERRRARLERRRSGEGG